MLDLCAAPGGKSAYAAQFAADGAVVAADVREHRVELIRQTAARLGVTNIETRVLDAREAVPEFNEKFDVVLVDAPCSALGLLYRKPDIKLWKQAEDIPALVELQRAIFSAAAGYVKRGGVLLYSTCTINREENGENVDWFLQAHTDYREDDLRNYLPEALMGRADGGRMQLFPHIDRIDGFFMARLKRC